MIYDDIWYIFRNHPSKSLRCWKLPKTWDNQGLMGLRLLRRHTGRRVVIQRNSHALQAFLGTKTAWEAYATRNSSRSCMIHQLIRGLPLKCHTNPYHHILRTYSLSWQVSPVAGGMSMEETTTIWLAPAGGINPADLSLSKQAVESSTKYEWCLIQ